jgi:uncharacterized repeat protein (TIGR01451 family)
MRKSLLFLVFIAFSQYSFSQVMFKVLYNNCISNIDGEYNFTYVGPLDGSDASWNSPNMLLPENTIQGCLVLMNDGTPGMTTGIGTPPLNVPNYTLGCDTANISSQDLTGKIAVIYRGTCEFGLKAYNAQKRGAIGVIIINHTGEAVGMGGGVFGQYVNIPVLQLGRTDGDLLVSCIDITCSGVYAFFGVSRVSGRVFFDLNQDCINDSLENGIPTRNCIINPGNISVQTNNNGYWGLDSLPAGNYTITVDTSGNWQTTCPTTQNFTVINPDSITIAPNFGFISTQPCAAPDISVNMPFMRPCFTDQTIYVQACNTYLATGVLVNGYVELELDSLLTPTTSSIPYTSLGNNTYSFDVGDLTPGQCINFTVNTTVSCSTVLGQTLCMQANLYPADSCVFDSIPTPPIGGVEPCTLPWDNSSLSVNGWCQNDSIYFTVTNNGAFGNGDMLCYAPIRIYIDGVLTTVDSVLLVGGQTQTFVFASDGRTWRLEADQHPLHPGNSHPNATVELCGNPANWTPDLVNILPQNDADPVVDIYCGVVTGSYDPNDKTGYPLGIGNDYFVAPNGKIDYVIRFQNTGTDTAFTVVIRDTLDVDLDIFSVQSGVSSHNYTFKMFGPRVLEWTFNNILLPDSTADQDGSNGFVTFTVNQNPDLADGTVINNSASIYFDFNAPIFTNTTSHIINRGINYPLAVKETKNINNNSLFIYPNPTKNQLNIVLAAFQNLKIEIFAVDGKLIEQKSITKNTSIDVSTYKTGLYFINATNNNGEVYRNKFVKE